MAVDPGLLSALIEVQTLGQVSPAPPKERVPTRTDSVVVSDMLDRWLTDTSVAAAEQGCGSQQP